MIGFAIDVEQDGISGNAYGFFQVSEQHGVAEFIGEKVDGLSFLPVEQVLIVFQQVR